VTTTRPHTNRDDVSELDRLREDYRNWWSATEGWTRLEGAQKADALIAALGDEIAELTGQNIDLEVWRASAVKRAEQAEAEATEAWQKCREHEAEVAIRDRMLVSEYDSHTPKTAGYMRWFADLRARAEKEATATTR
jgi:hypothetical protein